MNDPDLYVFYDGYFTGPHHPPRPWPEFAQLKANARLDAGLAEFAAEVTP